MAQAGSGPDIQDMLSRLGVDRGALRASNDEVDQMSEADLRREVQSICERLKKAGVRVEDLPVHGYADGTSSDDKAARQFVKAHRTMSTMARAQMRQGASGTNDVHYTVDAANSSVGVVSPMFGDILTQLEKSQNRITQELVRMIQFVTMLISLLGLPDPLHLDQRRHAMQLVKDVVRDQGKGYQVVAQPGGRMRILDEHGNQLSPEQMRELTQELSRRTESAGLAPHVHSFGVDDQALTLGTVPATASTAAAAAASSAATATGASAVAATAPPPSPPGAPPAGVLGGSSAAAALGAGAASPASSGGNPQPLMSPSSGSPSPGSSPASALSSRSRSGSSVGVGVGAGAGAGVTPSSGGSV
jgi:hypothetical protein